MLQGMPDQPSRRVKVQFFHGVGDEDLPLGLVDLMDGRRVPWLCP